MSIIENFTEIYGQQCVNEIYDFMIENELLVEFEKIKNSKNDLFEFGVKYGIIEIVRFLYEQINVEYDHNVILGFDTTLNSSTETTNSMVTSQPITTGSSNNKLTIQVLDKFSKNRNICINYLIRMKRYSKQRCSNKKFYYRFNRKYIDLIA
ncbi:MAG: hypothetical protein MUO21_02910 [Nitrososphaeraceae archaeon]|nr:hypothetical protein [Nitrososphaeraceae archaeon]